MKKKKDTSYEYDMIPGTPVKEEELQRHPHSDFEEETIENEKTEADLLEEETEDAANFKYDEMHEKELDSAFENLDNDLKNEEVDEVEEETTEKPTEKPKAEVIAETKEEKRLLKMQSAKANEIIELEEENIILLKEAEKFDFLVSTMNSAPFVELKNLVKEGLKTYVDRDDDKEAQKKFNNFKAICQMQGLLKEYKGLADENRTNIADNENTIEDLKEELNEINEKLHNFQTKLDFEKTDEVQESDQSAKEGEMVENEVIEENSNTDELLGVEEVPF